jgi:WD40 repeat protein
MPALESAISDASAMLVYIGSPDAVRQAAFSPEGQRIVTATRDNTARVYRVLLPADLIQLLGK